MKYINFEKHGIVIFESDIKHSEMAEKFENDTPVSAGFVSIWDCSSDQSPRCHGRSETLKLESSPEDTKTLLRRLTR
jgi:hypothetical protein